MVWSGPSDSCGKGAAVGVSDDHGRVRATAGNAEVVEHGQDVPEQLREGVTLDFVRRRREPVTQQVRGNDLVAQPGEVSQLVLPAVG